MGMQQEAGTARMPVRSMLPVKGVCGICLMPCNRALKSLKPLPAGSALIESDCREALPALQFTSCWLVLTQRKGHRTLALLWCGNDQDLSAECIDETSRFTALCWLQQVLSPLHCGDAADALLGML